MIVYSLNTEFFNDLQAKVWIVGALLIVLFLGETVFKTVNDILTLGKYILTN